MAKIDLTGVPGQSVGAVMRTDYTHDISHYSRLDEKLLPEKANIALNLTTVLKDHRAPHAPVLMRTEIGRVTILDTADISLDFDYGAIASQLMLVLRSLSPVLSGHYRKSFKFVVNSRLVDSLPPRDRMPPVVGVTNTAGYAAKLDSKGQGPFHRAVGWLAVHPAVGSFTYRLGPYLPLQFAEEQTVKGHAFTLPTIWVGRLGTLLKARRIRRKSTRRSKS